MKYEDSQTLVLVAEILGIVATLSITYGFIHLLLSFYGLVVRM